MIMLSALLVDLQIAGCRAAFGVAVPRVVVTDLFVSCIVSFPRRRAIFPNHSRRDSEMS